MSRPNLIMMDRLYLIVHARLIPVKWSHFTGVWLYQALKANKAWRGLYIPCRGRTAPRLLLPNQERNTTRAGIGNWTSTDPRAASLSCDKNTQTLSLSNVNNSPILRIDTRRSHLRCRKNDLPSIAVCSPRAEKNVHPQELQTVSASLKRLWLRTHATLNENLESQI